MSNINIYGVFDKMIANVTLIDWDHATVKMCVISMHFIPNIFSFDKYGKTMREVLKIHAYSIVQCPLFLVGFNQHWNMSTGFRRIPQYEISL
jgi:hypothetical protein